jgi:hypothetical protein
MWHNGVSLGMPSSLINQVLEAYGGEARWQAARSVEACVSASGWAFRLKFQHPDDHIAVSLTVGRPLARYTPATPMGMTAVLDGQSVRLEDDAGKVVESRDDPARFFPYGRRALWWDALDRAYFSAYALWNYLTFPSLLLRPDITWTELPGSRLEGRFPASLPTHSELQTFYIDPASGRLLRHDYTAKVFGNWAKAANVVLEHGTSDGIPYPSRRRVTPVGSGGRPLPGPVLVDIDIHSWQLR